MEKQRILIIDDETTFTRMMRLNLEKTGAYEVREENRGRRGATVARVAGAERKLAEAQAIRERTRLDIEDDVRKAQANLAEAKQRREVAEASTQSAQEALRLVREQYRAGAATVTRYLEAEADQAQSEIQAVTAHHDALVARAFLQQAIGSWK